MKKSIILVTLLITVLSAQTQICDQRGRNTLSLSYEYTSSLPIGANMRIGRIAQDGKMSYLIGMGVHNGRITVDKQVVNTTLFSTSASIAYKMIHIPYSYSLHAVISGHLYEECDPVARGALRIIIPAGMKAFFIEPSVSSKMRGGIEAGVYMDL